MSGVECEDSVKFKVPDLELKTLPKSLRYEFLDTKMKRPVIVNADLGQIETKKLLHVLRNYPIALGYNISDLKGIKIKSIIQPVFVRPGFIERIVYIPFPGHAVKGLGIPG